MEKRWYEDDEVDKFAAAHGITVAFVVCLPIWIIIYIAVRYW